EADGRRGVTAELGDQPVVAAAGAYGILGAGGGGDPLEHGAVVVVEAAHQARIDLIGDADGTQRGAQRLEMRARVGVEVLGEQRRAADQLLQLRVLAVEDAQWVAPETAPAVAIEL